MKFRGKCEDNPILMLEPQFANNQEQALAKPAKMHNWGAVARDVTKMYLNECPKTEEIKFIINPLPQEYKCKVEGEDCFMVTRKANEWEPDTSQFDYKDLIVPIADFGDIVEVLAAGKFEILEDYSSFFAFYFESFIGVYSDHCSAYIKDPVAKDIFTIERKFADDGSLISESVDGPPRRINIERKYVDSFDRIFNSWKMWAVGQLMNRMLTSHHRETNPMLSAQLSMGFMTGNYSQLEEIVQGNCTNERIQTAYENMYNYTNNKPAITGKFTTEKEKLVKDKPNGNSAPQATKIIDTKRQENINEQNERAQAEATKRMEDFKARKAKGIAVHSGSKARQQHVVPNAYQKRKNIYDRGETTPNVYQPQDQAERLKQHQANQKKVQDLGLAHQKQMQEATQKFAQDMQSATTTEERNRISQKYREEQQQKTLELQKTIMEMQKQHGN